MPGQSEFTIEEAAEQLGISASELKKLQALEKAGKLPKEYAAVHQTDLYNALLRKVRVKQDLSFRICVQALERKRGEKETARDMAVFLLRLQEVVRNV